MTTTTTVTQDETLAAIERERETWDAALAGADEARLLAPGTVGDWSLRDLAAHLTVWEEYTLRGLEATVSGTPDAREMWPSELSDDDAINEWLRQSRQEQSLTEVLAASRAIFTRLAALAATLPEAALNDPEYFPTLDGEALGPAIVSGAYFSHIHADHATDIDHFGHASG